jgi:hypothetical protein
LERKFGFIKLYFDFLDNNTYKQFIFSQGMELIALLSSGKGTWAQISGLLKYGEWDNVILIGNDFAKQFTSEKKFEFIQVDLDKKIIDLKEEILKKLKGKIQGTEVALSIASGDGKEHMALISALISFPAGVRFTALTREGIIFL